jgi:hypothetical protein
LQDGVMLHRVLPWLWRLADEDAGRPEVPESLQQQLLEALECCPAAEDLQVWHIPWGYADRWGALQLHLLFFWLGAQIYSQVASCCCC